MDNCQGKLPEKNLPECLKRFSKKRRFAVWGVDMQKPKRPYQAVSRSKLPASSSNPETWRTFNETRRFIEGNGGQLGFGVMLGLVDGDDFDLVALDLDDCRDTNTGELVEWAERLVTEAGSYTEVTPSQAGLRILGTCPSSISVHKSLNRPKAGKLEVFAHTNRFITVTGHRLQNSPDVLSDISHLILDFSSEAAGPLDQFPVHSSGDERVARWFKELGQKGKWHNAMIRLAAHFVERGETDQTILSMEKIFTQDGYTAEQTCTELQGAISSARRKQYDKRHRMDMNEERSEVLKFYTLDELRSEPPPQMLIEGLFPERGVAIVAGQTGSMKTFLMISLGLSIAFGRKLGDLKVMQGDVLYMLNEGQSGFERRCRAWLEHHKLAYPDNFYVAKATPNLMQADSITPYIKLADDLGITPKLIVLDTFSKATLGADDNSTTDMAFAITTAYNLANHFRALVVQVDHVGKDQGRGVRGAYAKQANVDMVGMVSKATGVTIKTTKQKEEEDNQVFNFNLAEVRLDGADVPVLVYSQEKQVVPQEEFIMCLMRIMGSSLRKELRANFIFEYGEKSKDNFRSVIGRLKNKGKIIEKGGVLKIA